MWDDVIHPFPNCKDCIVEVWEMEKKIHPTLYHECNYLSMLEIHLIRVGKHGHREPISMAYIGKYFFVPKPNIRCSLASWYHKIKNVKISLRRRIWLSWSCNSVYIRCVGYIWRFCKRTGDHVRYVHGFIVLCVVVLMSYGRSGFK